MPAMLKELFAAALKSASLRFVFIIFNYVNRCKVDGESGEQKHFKVPRVYLFHHQSDGAKIVKFW